MNRTAWTGGSTPAPLSAITPTERAMVTAYFREQAREYLNFWGDFPPDVRRIFWGRARYDAHANMRTAA